MNFEKFFKFISYFAVLCGFLSLWVSGSFGAVGSTLFLGVMIGAWFLEGSRWQISEKIGTAMIVLAVPAYYFTSRFQAGSLSVTGAAVLVGMLGRLIITLTAIKLLQRKSDRDWVFLYLMSFFEVLLAAGLSISALYLGTFVLYLLVMVCAVVAFEIRYLFGVALLVLLGIPGGAVWAYSRALAAEDAVEPGGEIRPGQVRGDVPR